MKPEEAQRQTLGSWKAKALHGEFSVICAWCRINITCASCPLPIAFDFPAVLGCLGFKPYTAWYEEASRGNKDAARRSAQVIVDLLIENQERILEVAREISK